MGDSLNVINLLKGNSLLGWDISNMMEELRNIIDKVEHINLIHDYTEANHMADYLADKVVNWEE